MTTLSYNSRIVALKKEESVDDSGQEDAENRIDEPIEDGDKNSNDEGNAVSIQVRKYSSENAFFVSSK